MDGFTLILQSSGIIAASAIIGELLRRGITAVSAHAGASREVTRRITEGVRITWIIVAAVGVLTVTGVASAFQALTLPGLVGLAITLALQTTLSNIIAGLMLFNDKTLRIHDVISYGGVKGTVIKINLRSTWIRNEEGNIMIISNSTLLSGPFINFTAEGRLKERL